MTRIQVTRCHEYIDQAVALGLAYSNPFQEMCLRTWEVYHMASCLLAPGRRIALSPSLTMRDTAQADPSSAIAVVVDFVLQRALK